MAYKTRGGRCYQYRNERIDGRIVTTYMGPGSRADAAEAEPARAERASADTGELWLIEDGGTSTCPGESTAIGPRTSSRARASAPSTRPSSGGWSRRRRPAGSA